MAQSTDIVLPPATWTLLTNSNVTAARLQLKSGNELHIKATVGETAPTTLLGSIVLDARAILPADVTIAALFPGVSGANRIYGYCETGGVVSVSHA